MKNKRESLDKLIHHCINPVDGIAYELRKEGFDIAGHLGVRARKGKPARAMLGILKNQEPVEKKFLGFSKNVKSKAHLIGEIWFNKDSKYSTPEGEPILMVYGKEYLPVLKNLFRGFSHKYNVYPKLQLMSDTPRQETYLHEVTSQKKEK